MADTATTLGRSSKSTLSLQEQARGFSHKFTINYDDVNTGTGATDTETVTLGTTPSKWYVDKALVNVRTAFAGTTAFALTVGTTTTADLFVTSQSVKTQGVLLSVPTSAAIKQVTAATSLTAVFTNATGGSPSALTAGVVDIYLNIVDLTRPTVDGLG